MKDDTITLLDGQMTVQVYHDQLESAHEDDIYFEFREPCDPKHRLFKADKVRFAVTPAQADAILLALHDAAWTSRWLKGKRDTSPLILREEAKKMKVRASKHTVPPIGKAGPGLA